jgi:formylglycine-generating enzyme required for sulfatase activity
MRDTISDGRLACVLAVVLCAATASKADEVDDLIATLKPSPVDHAVWAEALLKAADGLQSKPKAQIRLYEAAYQHGMKSAKGLPPAIRAARLVLDAAPQKPREWHNKLLAALNRDWQAADRGRKKQAAEAYAEQMVATADELVEMGATSPAIQLYSDALRLARYYAPEVSEEAAEKLKDVRERERLEREADQCRGILTSSPGNTAVREKLIYLLVVELDKPAEAKELLTGDVSQTLRTYVPLATMEVEQVAKECCLELGDWYESLAGKAPAGGKAKALARAKAYFERFVEMETDAVRRTIGETKLARVDKHLGELNAPQQPVGRYLRLALARDVRMKLVLVPAGTFVMGSPASEESRDEDESPQHQVRISRPFFVSVTEVTQAQYQVVMRDNPSDFKDPNRPVEKVRWDDAVEFCKRLSQALRRPVRLPTEAEWEYTCRAGTRTPFFFGDDEGQLRDYAWYMANSGQKTQPAGGKKPNPWGLYDTYGNVWEWCLDYHDGKYHASAKRVNPTGPPAGSSRVLRGGAWDQPPGNCRSACRVPCIPGGSDIPNVGFRVVIPARR